MSKLKILAAAGLVAMTTSSAFAADLSLFGVNATNVPAADTSGGAPVGGATGGTTDGRSNAVMQTNSLAIFSQQAVGNSAVNATLDLSSSSGIIYSSIKDGAPASTVTETGRGATGDTSETKTENTVTGYTDISRSTVTNLLTIQNSATNASATFMASDLASVNFGGTPRVGAELASNLTTNGENLLAQQVLSDAATTATATITEITTTNTNTVNNATGASALINLRQQ